MSFFVSDDLKNVITEEDLIESSNKDISLLLEYKSIKEEYFVRSYKKENNFNTFVVETNNEISILFNANNLNVKHSIVVGDNYFLKGEGLLEIKEFSQDPEENLISCKIVIKQRGAQ